MKHSHTTLSEDETRSLAASFARKIVARPTKDKPEHPLVLLLSGELGSGKTTFTKAFLAELGVEQSVTSPTFVLVNRYDLSDAGEYNTAYHIDAYRLADEPQSPTQRPTKEVKNEQETSEAQSADEAETESLLKEPLSSLDNIVLIEWPENLFIGKQPGFPHWELQFSHGEKPENRKIVVDNTTSSL